MTPPVDPQLDSPITLPFSYATKPLSKKKQKHLQHVATKKAKKAAKSVAKQAKKAAHDQKALAQGASSQALPSALAGANAPTGENAAIPSAPISGKVLLVVGLAVGVFYLFRNRKKG
jgi:hypothetical protein